MKNDIYGSMPSDEAIREHQKLTLRLAILTILFATISLIAFLTIGNEVFRIIITVVSTGLGLIVGVAFVVLLFR